MNFLQAFILSFVEGFSEFLPISSTGHLILASKLLNITQTDFVKSFEIIIQLGAIFAVIFLYWGKISKDVRIWKKIITAFIPTAIIGFLLYKVIKVFLLGNSTITVLSLFIGGIIIIFMERSFGKKIPNENGVDKISYRQAFLIGLFQTLSVIPGVSRSAVTIISALFLGTKRIAAVEFSFLLAIPTMLAATALDIVEINFAFSQQESIVLLIGFLGSFLFAIISIKFLLNFIKTNTFIPFGIYRIIIAIIFGLFILK
jgi:undecaprenyl-diphosphatase